MNKLAPEARDEGHRHLVPAKVAPVQDIWPQNQWPATLLRRSIEDTCVAEQASSASKGEPVSLAALWDKITRHWLDAMIPAGNA